MVKMKISYTTQ